MNFKPVLISLVLLSCLVSADMNFDLKSYFPDNAVVGTLTSLWNEYVSWSAQFTNQLVDKMKTEYGFMNNDILKAVIDVPVIGAVFFGFALLFSGHLGALLFIANSCVVFVFAIFFLLRAVGIKDKVQEMLFNSNLLATVITTFLAVFLAIGIITAIW